MTERVILPPSDTERPSAVVVQAGETEVLLDTPYTSADRRGSVLQSNALTAEEIKRRCNTPPILSNPLPERVRQ